MNADERRSQLDQVTEKIIGCAHQVGLNYLKSTSLNVCLLVNFGVPKAVVKE